MYKQTSELSQRRARQLWLADLMGKPFEALPLEQQCENLKRAIRQLDAALTGVPNGARRAHLLGQMEEARAKLAAMRAREAAPVDVNKHFIDVARAQLSPYQFKLILMEAMKRANRPADRPGRPDSGQ